MAEEVASVPPSCPVVAPETVSYTTPPFAALRYEADEGWNVVVCARPASPATYEEERERETTLNVPAELVVPPAFWIPASNAVLVTEGCTRVGGR